MSLLGRYIRLPGTADSDALPRSVWVWHWQWMWYLVTGAPPASGHVPWTRIASALERLVDMQADAVARERESQQGLARWQQEVAEYQLQMIEIQETMAKRSREHNDKCEREMAMRRAEASPGTLQ